MTNNLLIGPFEQIITFESVALNGPLRDEDLVIRKGWIFCVGKIIKAIGDKEDLLKYVDIDKSTILELEGKQIALPGFIDAHTHICFAGSRSNDYAMRNAGKSYLEIAKSGGGIWDTVTQTRNATQDELINGVVQRAQILLENGITTIEVKSGYGLSVEEELKMLRAIKTAETLVVADLIPTCLAAHIKPKDFEGSHKDYLDYIKKELFPILKEEQLTNRIDAFIEEEAFSSEVVRSYFEKAKQMGFDITVHADQFSTGGSKVAIEHEAVSADHLEASQEEEIKMLASSSTVSVALPGATLGLGCPFTPARKILDAGGSLAIASDWNPGSAPMGHLITQAAILGTFQKLSNAEVLAAVTCRAAHALRLENIGRLKEGYQADIVIFESNNFNEILYKQGQLKPSRVIKNGKLKVGG